MDKRLILAVAGSGKTTHILNQLDEDKTALNCVHIPARIFAI